MVRVARTADVVVIGGGVIGLSVAFHLRQAASGLRVVVADAGAIGSGDRGQASWAAAGMLAPFAESQSAGAFVRLGAESLCRYPDFLNAVRAAAGGAGDPALAITGAGMLRVATDDAEAERLRSLAAWQTAADSDLELVSPERARGLEPALVDAVRLALLSPRERAIDPRRLTATLAAACRALGVTLLESYGFRAATRRKDGWAVTVGDTELECGTAVLAAGAWSAAAGSLFGLTLPVAPVRGQICALRSPAGLNLTHTIYGTGVYIVPRPDGRIIVGATEEPAAGFDIGTDLAAIDTLRQRAVGILPALAGAQLDGPAWAGLRPGTPNGKPILGAVRGDPTLHVATGHYRNGILLTPITGKIMAHGILTGERHPLLAEEFLPSCCNRDAILTDAPPAVRSEGFPDRGLFETPAAVRATGAAVHSSVEMGRP